MTNDKVKLYTPTTGQTIQMEDADRDMTIILSPAADIAALTLNWPANPHDGMHVIILSNKNITAVSHTGGTLNHAFSTMPANTSISYRYDAINSTWMNEVDTTVMNTDQFYYEGVLKTGVKRAVVVGVTSGGSVILPLTINKVVGGTPLFTTEVYPKATLIQIGDKTQLLPAEVQSFAGDLKSVTINVNKAIVSVGVLVLSAATNGQEVIAHIFGK